MYILQTYKTFIVMIVFLMIHSISSSQYILKENEKNYICYTEEENRIIGIFILENISKDSIIAQQEVIQATLKNQILLLNSINNNNKEIVSSIEKDKDILKEQRDLFKADNKRYRIYNKILIGVTVAITIIALLQ